MFEISPEVEQITITKFFKGLILAIIKMLNNNVFSKKKSHLNNVFTFTKG